MISATRTRSARVYATGLGSGAPTAAAALVARGVKLVVVGGCALVIHGVADRCGDLDLVPEPDAANLIRLCGALDSLGASRTSLRAISRSPLTSVSSPFGRIDLMIETARREYRELAANASDIRVAGVSVRVASIADVLRLRERFRGRSGE